MGRRFKNLAAKVEELEGMIHSVEWKISQGLDPILEERRDAALTKAGLKLVKYAKIIVAPVNDKRSRDEVLEVLRQIIPDAVGTIQTMSLDQFGHPTAYNTAWDVARDWKLLKGTEAYPYNTLKKKTHAPVR
jgi:hypothetical protein